MQHNGALIILLCLSINLRTVITDPATVDLVKTPIGVPINTNTDVAETPVLNATVRLDLVLSRKPVHWTYEQKMEDNELLASDWAKYFPKCSGTRQSPLWIDTTKAVRDPKLRPMSLIDYDDTTADDLWSVVNNGHAVQFSGYFRTPPQMQGRNLPGKYIFQQMHFHWGSNSSIGSEHKLDGRSYPLEVHLVHRRKNVSDEEAHDKPDGMAVIGVLFEVTKTREYPNRHMEDIISALRKVTVPGRAVNVTLPQFSLSEFIPENPSFIRYMGSLTTPPCSEAVVWSVMTTPLKITETQLNVFRSLMKTLAAKASVRSPLARTGDDLFQSKAAEQIPGGDVLLRDNFRPIQPINERSVLYYDASNDPSYTSTPSHAMDGVDVVPRITVPAPVANPLGLSNSTAAKRVDPVSAKPAGDRVTGNSADPQQISRFVICFLTSVVLWQSFV